MCVCACVCVCVVIAVCPLAVSGVSACCWQCIRFPKRFLRYVRYKLVRWL